MTDLDVDRGEVAVIGPSGSDKTLLRCVNFLESYERGSIRIGARRRPGERSPTRMRAETGMVFQAFNLFPHLSAAANVMLGLPKVRNKSRDKARAIAERWLERVGLADKADSLPALSGGQQQRVGVAGRWRWSQDPASR